MFNYIMQFKRKRIGLNISKWGKSTQVWCMLTEVPERDHTLAAMHIEGSTFIQVQHKTAHTASTETMMPQITCKHN